MSLRKIFIYSILLVFAVAFAATNEVHAQWTLDVVGTVKKEENKKRFEGVTINIKRNGGSWKTLTTESSGKFEASLEPNAVYVIEFTKPGHVSKRIEFSTKNVPPEDAKYGFEFPMEMNLFEKIDGLDVSILNQPIAKVAFDPSTGYMDYDAAYTKSIKAELDRLKKELAERLKQLEEERKAKQAEYDKTIALADKAYGGEKWSEAKPLYEKALGIFPNEDYPQERLDEITEKLAAQAEQDKFYNKAIADADAAFNAKDYNTATLNYQKASGLKPNEAYPKDRIKEIEDLIANQKKLDENYAAAIAEADNLLTAKDYEKSKSKYEEASGLKPDEKYPKDKIAEIDKIIADQLKADQEYNEAIAEADKLFEEKNYENAITSYQKAATAKPEESYPTEKIAEAQKLWDEQKQREGEYNDLIAAADGMFGAEDYENAKAKYEEALGIKPTEEHPKSRITEIESILAELAQKEAEAKALEEKYQQLITEGDKLFGDKKYEEAKGKFEEAVTLKEEEAYPKEKLAEIDKIIAENLEADKAYNEAIAEADKLFEEKSYENAISSYQKAATVKPEESYPTEKIAEAQKLLDEQKQREEEYSNLIAAADGMFGSEDYENAKSKYEEALALKLEEEHPSSRIKEIEGLLADLADKKALEEKYQQLIAEGDKLFGDEKYEDAKGKFEEALTLKSEEAYPKEKIAEIDTLLQELAEKKAEEEAAKAIQDKYDGLIAEADGAFNGENYNEAKAKYQEALTVKADETYPQEKITEIDNLLAELAKKKAEEEAANMAAKELDEKYQAVIAEADAGMGSEDYDLAKQKYNEALGLKSEEEYPKTKLKEIEDILAELAKKKAEAEAAMMAEKERDEKYQALIAEADNSLSSKDYDNAKQKYNEASGVKPDESYPQTKLDEIEQLLAQMAKDEEDKLAAEAAKKKKEYYDAIVAQADAELASKNYDEAKAKYNEALGVLPEETYPTTKIKEIDDLLAKLKADENASLMAEQVKEVKYKEFITKADNLFDAEDYESSKQNYQSALGVKPAEAYPTNRIAEIDKLIAAKEEEITVTNNALKQKQEQYDNFVKLADEAFTKELYNDAITNYNSALGIMPNETYPKERIAAIEQLLADLEQKAKEQENAQLAEKEKKEKYNQLIYAADRAFKFKKYDNAKSDYEAALALFPDESYPKEKLAEIANLPKEEEEETIAVTTNTGGRVGIDDSKERELEEMMANWIENRDADKNVAIQAVKDNQAVQQDEQVKKLDEKIKATNEQLIQLEADIAKQKEAGNEFHKENFDSLETFTSNHNQKEFVRIDASETKRQGAKEEIITLEARIREFNDSQDQQLEDKVNELYSFADEVNERKTVLIEDADDRRSDNHNGLVKEEEKIRKDMELGEKRRKDREIDLINYQKELTKQRDGFLKASSKKRKYSQDSLVDMVAALHKQQLKSAKFYESNVKDLEKFEKQINKRKEQQMNRAGKRTAANQDALEGEVARIEKAHANQQKKYYKKIAYLEAYKSKQAEYEGSLVASQEKNYISAKNQINSDRKRYYGEIQKKQGMHLENVAEVDNTKQKFDDFTLDLNEMSLSKVRGVEFDHLYAGEKRMKQNMELSNKYPQGISEETYEEANAVVLKRIKITGTQADIYERRFYKWGGTFYTKNGHSITKTVWDLESIE